MFKTQLLNSYTPNTYNLNSAFLSPGELNVGLGMPYNDSLQNSISLAPVRLHRL